VTAAPTMSSKYDGITRLLAGRTEPTVTLEWRAIDKAVGGLPTSAREYGAWWHGDRPQVRAWQSAGYILDTVRPGRFVTFRRSTAPTPSAGAQPRRHAAVVPARTLDPHGSGPAETAAVLGAFDPHDTLIVIPCSKRKRRGGAQAEAATAPPWSPELIAARERLAAAAERDERRLLPAWQRYTGHFYDGAGSYFADAVRTGADLVILSGGYGVLRVEEPIGWYERRLQLSDWPDNLLGRELAAYAARRGLHAVVAFAAATSPYAEVVRRAPWPPGVEDVGLVTVTAPGGGAQVIVPRDLGRAFAMYWTGNLGRLPETVSVSTMRRSRKRPYPDPAQPSRSPLPSGAVSTAVTYLADRNHAVPASQFNPADRRLAAPGLYAWWADEAAVDTLARALGPGIEPLIYAGQAGATTRRSLITRRANLRGRISGQHLRAETRGSTFALTLAAALQQRLGLRFESPRRIDPTSRARLSAWMREHLAVATYPVPDPSELAWLEERVLDRLDPPLNLEGRPPTPVRTALAQLRHRAGSLP
jgi:hypothetical protein